MSAPILSIQSAVSYGYVGNSAAVFPMQRMGFDVWAVHTTCLSNHVGYPTNGGYTPGVDQLRSQLDGLVRLPQFAELGCVLTGYLASAELAHELADFIEELRLTREDIRFICDPVMGDHGRVYVPLDLVECFQERLCPMADMIVPNAFELGLLAGFTIETLSDAKQAARHLSAELGAAVVATGIHTHPDHQHIVACQDDHLLVVRAPHIEGRFAGSGDVFTALLTAWTRKGYPLYEALVRATSAMTTIIEYPAAAGGGELRLIAAQDELRERREDVVLVGP